MSEKEAGEKSRQHDPDNGKLLHEIEAISKALHPDSFSRITASTATSRGKSIGQADRSDRKSLPRSNSKRGSGGGAGADHPQKDKKSFWSWKPLKALSQSRSLKFSCCFTLQIHKIENLLPALEGASMCVHWKRRDGELVSNPAKVVGGTAEFEEQLVHTCPVHASRKGPHHSTKYEAKHCVLYATVKGKPEIDLGKQRVDLTRLLPLTFEELENEKNSGKWNTTYRLQGKAMGAIMNVSFGYLVLGDSRPPPNNKSVLELLGSAHIDTTKTKAAKKGADGGDGKITVERSENLPKDERILPAEDAEVLNEVLPPKRSASSDSLRMLDKKVASVKGVNYASKHSKSISLSHIDSSKENYVYPAVNVSVVEKGIPEAQEGNVHDAYDSTEVCGASDMDSLYHVHSSKENYDGNVSVVEKGIPEAQEENVHDAYDSTEVCGASDMDSLYHVHAASDVGSALQTEVSSPLHELSDNVKGGAKLIDCIPEGNTSNFTRESLLEELESALNDAEDLERAGMESSEMESELGDLQLAENEFLNMLGIEDSPSALCSESEVVEPESPRERLLREFERETEACGYSLFDFDEDDEEEYDCYAPSTSEWGYSSETNELQPANEFYEERQFLGQEGSYHAPRAPVWDSFADEFELPTMNNLENVDNTQFDNQECRIRPRAKVLEDLETEALMREWGLNEKAFERSPPPPPYCGGSHSPVAEFSPQLPPLGEGLSPFIQTEDGGFLRSMNPSHFRNSKSGGSLIMQVSRPVVVPAEMGSGVIEIMESLASVGLEKLSMQANKLMPLEDINGKTMERIAWEASNEQEPERLLHDRESHPVVSAAHSSRAEGRSSRERSTSKISMQASDDSGSEFVSLEDLAPLAMDKIESLSVEGLRIQSDFSEEEAPSNVIAKSTGLEGAVGLKLLGLRDSDDMDDGLMGLSLTLDEWMKLDSGELDEEEMSERTSKILAAHHANCTDVTFVGNKGDTKKKRGKKGPRGRCGVFGNNFTVALMVQLRDPFRDYEPVGTPMLALIQVERVFVPPKPRIYSKVSELKSNIEEDDDDENKPSVDTEKESEVEEKVVEEELVPQYKVAEVHVAGLKTEPGKKTWGSNSAAQQQSGSRWLLANGMGKSKKSPFLKSRGSLGASAVAQSGDTLWSISTRVHGTGTRWKDLAALNPHIRNPNVIIPKETVIRLR